MSVPWYRRAHLLIAAAVFVLAVGVYTATLAPTISFWDCGEFITCSHIVGVPHQPGTPLYVLVGRVFDVVFGSGDIGAAAMRTAWAVNFMSAVFSALAVMFVYLLVLDLSRRAYPDGGWLAHAGGIIGALFLLFSQTFWNNAIEAEVYGLSAFMVSGLTWLALRWYDACRERRSEQLLLLIVYLLGLGVGFHLGSLLVYPGIFVLILAVGRRRTLPLIDLLLMSAGLALFLLSTMAGNDVALLWLLFIYLAAVVARSIQGRTFTLLGTLLFVFGLSVHLMMLIRAGATPEPAINQTDPETFDVLMSVLRREQYPPIDPMERRADIVWQFRYYYDFFLQQFSFIDNGRTVLAKFATLLGPIALGLLGIFQGIRRARPVIWMLVVNYLINADGLTLFLNFTDHEVRERDYFYFAGFLFFAVFIGLGATALLRYASGPEGETSAQLEAKAAARRARDGARIRKAAPGRDRKGSGGSEPALESPAAGGVEVSGATAVTAVRTGLLAKATAVMLIVIAALPLLQPGHVKWFEHDRHENRIAYEYAKNILAGLDEHAILFTNGDNDTFPIWYLQEVEHFRRDVTVVNLSLVNLSWYVKQLRRREPPLPLTYTDAALDDLKAYAYVDSETGRQTIVYVRDYVVHDIVTENARAAVPRPVFFAVTIPRENMARYYPKLQMEGLAYRLTPTDGRDGLPKTDARRLLANMFGTYDFDALLDGESESRHIRFAEMAGWATDSPQLRLNTGELPTETKIDYLALLDEVGASRTDIYRNANTVHLLGNYPAALIRAGYELIVEAERVALDDTVTYENIMNLALASFKLVQRFDPYNEQAADFYPLILIQKGRSDEALAYLDSVVDHLSEDGRRRSVTETVLWLSRIGQDRRAVRWLNDRIAGQPDEKFYYTVLFAVFQNLGQALEAQDVMDRWQAQSGQVDPEMKAAVERLRSDALQREQRKIEDAVEGSGG